MVLLAASIAALFLGPLLARVARTAQPLVQALDGYVVVAIAGLALLHVLPESVAHGGWLAVVAAAAGLLVPLLVERVLAGGHAGVLGVAIAGLLLHAATDGAALSVGGTHLGYGVVLHRVPLGLLLWWALAAERGPRVAVAFISLVALATVGGYAGGAPALAQISTPWLAAFQAFVVGSLLHVVAHHATPSAAHDHEHEHDHDAHDFHDCHDHPPEPDKHRHWPALVGALLAVATLALLGEGDLSHQHDAAPGGEVFLRLALAAAPLLVLAYLGAGLIRAFLPAGHPTDLARDGRVAQALRGLTYGGRVPVCSCDVLPRYRTLIAAGVPITAALAFLVAAPDLGLAALLVSLPLLGAELTAARLVAATALALLVALALGRRSASRKATEPAPPRAPFDERLAAGMRYGLGDLVDHTLPWVLLGLALAAFLEPVLAEGALSSIPAALQVPLFAMVGAPLYLCAAGATPIAAVLVHKGVSAGAAIALLLSGPALNTAAAHLLGSLHGRRFAAGFVVLVIACASGLGWLTDLLVTPTPFSMHAQSPATPLQMAGLAILGVLLLRSVVRQGPRGLVYQVTGALHAH